MKTIHEANNRRRDRVVEKARVKQDSDENLEKALTLLGKYLKERHKNNTPERKLTLETLYRLDSPVDIETLASLMAEAHPEMKVCRTTVYNNLQSFAEAHLVRKVQLLGNPTCFYEKTVGVEEHGYCICQGCGSIKTISMSAMTEDIQVQLPKTFHIFDYGLCVTGLCYKCQIAERKALKAKAKALSEAQAAAKLAAEKKSKKKKTNITKQQK